MITAKQLLAQPHLKNLRELVEKYPMPSACWEIANHPRDGLRPCLALRDSKGQCAVAHRHVK